MNKLKNSLKKDIDTERVKKQAEQITDKSKLENRNEKQVRLSVSIVNDKHKQLKIYCIENDSDIQTVVSTLIDKLLNNEIII